jgi:hypothetical protein
LDRGGTNVSLGQQERRMSHEAILCMDNP